MKTFGTQLENSGDAEIAAASHKFPVLICGCAGQATHAQDHDGLGKNHPSCIVHETCKIAIKPILDGRRARCAYFGKEVKRSSYNSNCCDKCAKVDVCVCEDESSSGLWFFKFKGEGSEEATQTCKNCKQPQSWHWPRWKLVLKQTRRWYKIDPYVSHDEYIKNLPSKEMADLWAEKEADRRLHWSDHHEETKVRKVEIVSIKELMNLHPCLNFEEHGAFDFDEFYCACHGCD